MISFEHECIFIHIPKCAGTSIEKKLGHFESLERDTQDHRTLRELEPFALHHLRSCFTRGDMYFPKHWKQKFEGMPMPTRRQYHDFYKFTFVRNPWARVFSWYRNVMADPLHRQRIALPEELSLHEFLIRFGDNWGLRPQLYWIQDSRGHLPYDFVGRFENLAGDFATIGKALGLPDPELPRLVVGDGKRYTDHYDQRSVDLVAARYRQEIELFDYEFGN